ncbi:MAG: coenzyme F420-0:L-glutamate ligase [Candidatus Hermodarchaeota archaeon]
MADKIKLIGLKGIPLVKPGDNIPEIILTSLKKNNIELENGDILVIAQTIISKYSNRLVDLNTIKPSKKAQEIYKRISSKVKDKNLPKKSPELIHKILEESNKIIKEEHVLIVETKHGFICANAGIDKSNIEGNNIVSLLPENSDLEATKIRNTLKKLTNKEIAIIISDSFGRPFRIGAVGVALGVSGMSPILDKRGDKDLFNHELQTTIIGQADNLASAAQLIMGEADEGLPIVLIRGYKFDFNDKASIQDIIRDRKNDLFRAMENENSFQSILKNRRSYKNQFDSKDVDLEIINKCINLARWAPNAHNAQPWRYIIMKKGKVRQDLIKRMNEKLKDDLKREGKSESFIKNKINRTRNQFLTAPVLILLCLDSHNLEIYANSERNQNEFLLGIQSISASATYLLLAFEINKLAACWYCAPLFAKELVLKSLKLPESFIPMAFFTVGYPIKIQKAPKRKDLEEIVFELE